MDIVQLLIILVSIFLMVVMVIMATCARLFYKQTSEEEALIRRGRDGAVAVAKKGQGLWAIPHFHEIQYVPLRLVVTRFDHHGEDALVTSDKIKVDVEGVAFVSLGDEPDDILRASQFSESELDAVIRDSVTDTVRAATTKFTFRDLQLQRSGHIDCITSSLAGELSQRHRPADAPQRPPRPGRTHPKSPAACAQRGLCCPP